MAARRGFPPKKKVLREPFIGHESKTMLNEETFAEFEARTRPPPPVEEPKPEPPPPEPEPVVEAPPADADDSLPDEVEDELPTLSIRQPDAAKKKK